MAIVKDKNNWVGMFPKTYGLVVTKYGTHKRNYNRKIKNGLTVFEAESAAMYADLPEFKEDFFIKS